MASEKLKGLLNDAIAAELSAIIQYMWQHVLVIGKESAAISDVFEKISIEEMKHAEAIAERLDYLGGVPTTKPTPIEVGETLEEMLQNDVAAEEGAIKMYRGIVEMAEAEKDYTTRELFLDILADEEDHHNTFTTLQGK